MSSLRCPQCSNAIDADFGVVTCSQCQSVLFIDMEGKIQLRDGIDTAENPNQASQVPVAESQSAANANAFNDNWVLDQSPESSQATIAHLDPEPEPNSEAFQEASRYNDSFAENSMEANDSEQTLTRAPRKISEVSEFSNSDQVYGPLSYSVTIEQIDTKEIRQQLAEALSDPKFQWDARELLKRIEMGKLFLENLSPVKASVLIHSLQTLPVKVSWVQNVYA